MKRYLLTLLVTAAVVSCCEPKPAPEPEFENSVALANPAVDASDNSGQYITVLSEEQWSATIEYGTGQANWATLGMSSGEGDALVKLNYTRNILPNERTLEVVVTFESGDIKRATLTQSASLTPPLPAENTVHIALNRIGYDYAAYVSISIDTEVSWTAAIDFAGAPVWAGLDLTSGYGPRYIQLLTTANSANTERNLTVIVSFSDGDIKSVPLTQAAAPVVEPPTPSQPGWTELPEVTLPNDGYYFVTHYATAGNGSKVRNYSMLYDASTYTAYWIAFPLSGTYVGSVGRTNAWGYDPLIPESKQVNLSSSYGSSAPNDWGIYSRGHQIASADRNASQDMNRQTFYYTNMTPQAQQFNGVIWENLESKLQSMAKSGNGSDTLWVVTGAIIRTVGGNEPIEYITKDGKQIPIPNYYYKVVIKRSGSTYTGCGFWFTHRQGTYSGSSTSVKIANTKTIREIEGLTGYNFFCNLSQADQNAAETSITYSVWGL